jgi:hypothetical protein
VKLRGETEREPKDLLRQLSARLTPISQPGDRNHPNDDPPLITIANVRRLKDDPDQAYRPFRRP